MPFSAFWVQVFNKNKYHSSSTQRKRKIWFHLYLKNENLHLNSSSFKKLIQKTKIFQVQNPQEWESFLIQLLESRSQKVHFCSAAFTNQCFWFPCVCLAVTAELFHVGVEAYCWSNSEKQAVHTVSGRMEEGSGSSLDTQLSQKTPLQFLHCFWREKNRIVNSLLPKMYLN